jgi:hypothetical protein|tara:strand:- start:5280 stop:6326 length:1047 start_codon:yes stop_codon:yes gene_type:complete
LLNKSYSFPAKFLHHLALGSTVVAEASFDIEQALNKVSSEGMNESPVFVSGLARAGTTILMRSLYETNQFGSLTYRDMPFVLMPATWAKFSSSFQQDMTPMERAHGDSIAIDYDSPEAFEEIFWRVFYGKQYIKATHLERHVLNNQACKQFKLYVAAVLGSRKSTKGLRYLSKNNNNLLRLSGIKKSFPDSCIIIPFREPVQHALSLYRQHKNFVTIQSDDKFSLKYMTWLGHHEFGLNHKPFNFSDDKTQATATSQDSVEYWLAQWISAYNYTLENAPPGTIFLSYEDLCLNPVETLSRLMTLLNIPYNKDVGNSILQPENHIAVDIDEKMLASSQNTYARLLAAKF